jgi:MFS family permease
VVVVVVVVLVLMVVLAAYWQLLVTRVGIAFGEAACRPTASSLLADMFPAERMAL